MHPWTKHYHEVYCSVEDAEKWFALEEELRLDFWSQLNKNAKKNAPQILKNLQEINLFKLFPNKNSNK